MNAPQRRPHMPDAVRLRLLAETRNSFRTDDDDSAKTAFRRFVSTKLQAESTTHYLNEPGKRVVLADSSKDQGVGLFRPAIQGGPDYLDPGVHWRAGREVDPPEERLRRARAELKEAFKSDGYSLAETTPQRVAAAWRIMRELGRVRGDIKKGETMLEALSATSTNADPWSIPRKARSRPPKSRRIPAGQHVLNLHHDYERRDGHGGFAFQPPEVDPSWIEDADAGGTQIAADYTEDKDRGLQTWALIVEQIASYLSIRAGSHERPNYGTLAMGPLTDLGLIRLCWPTRMQILYFEAFLIDQVIDRLDKSSPSKIQKWLKLSYGLGPHESADMVAVGMRELTRNSDLDVEEQKALMVHRLESYIDRARDSLDLKAEINGLKQLAIVVGLTKTDPEDSLAVFGQIVHSYDVKDAAKITQMPTLEG